MRINHEWERSIDRMGYKKGTTPRTIKITRAASHVKRTVMNEPRFRAEKARIVPILDGKKGWLAMVTPTLCEFSLSHMKHARTAWPNPAKFSSNSTCQEVAIPTNERAGLMKMRNLMVFVAGGDEGIEVGSSVVSVSGFFYICESFKKEVSHGHETTPRSRRIRPRVP